MNHLNNQSVIHQANLVENLCFVRWVGGRALRLLFKRT